MESKRFKLICLQLDLSSKLKWVFYLTLIVDLIVGLILYKQGKFAWQIVNTRSILSAPDFIMTVFILVNPLLRIERYTKHNNVNLKVIDYKPTGSVSGVLGQFLAVDAYQVKKLDENKGQLLWVSQSSSSIWVNIFLHVETTSPSGMTIMIYQWLIMTSYEPVDLSVDKWVTTNDGQTDHSHVILNFVLTKDPF